MVGTTDWLAVASLIYLLIHGTVKWLKILDEMIQKETPYYKQLAVLFSWLPGALIYKLLTSKKSAADLRRRSLLSFVLLSFGFSLICLPWIALLLRIWTLQDIVFANSYFFIIFLLLPYFLVVLLLHLPHDRKVAITGVIFMVVTPLTQVLVFFVVLVSSLGV